MNYNPYAAPQAAPPPGGASGAVAAGAAQPWEIGEVLSVAWAVLKANWVIAVFAPFLGLLAGDVPALACGFVAGFLRVIAAQNHDRSLLTVAAVVRGVGTLVTYVLMSGIYVGVFRMALGMVRGQAVPFGIVFTGFRRMLPMFATILLVYLLFALGFVCLIVPGVILGLGLGYAPYFVADRDTMGPIAALKASWEVTNGHKTKLFVFGLACMGLMLLGYAMCCVGIFAMMPLVILAQAVVYTRLTGTGGNEGPPMPVGMGGMGPAPAGYGAPPPGGFGYGPPGVPQGGGYGPPGGGGYGR